MNKTTKNISIRWLYLVVGVLAMLFAGIIYAWSILKTPFIVDFGWTSANLSLNFTLTLWLVCIGGLVGSLLSKRMGPKITLITASFFCTIGFILTSMLTGSSIALLYIAYGLLAGLGIGITYNVIVSTVGAWFPDKIGLCSGSLMMGFGASALVLGNLAAFLFESSIGWRTTYVVLGTCMGGVILIAGLILKLPSADIDLPQPKTAKSIDSDGPENFEHRDYTSKEMIRRPSFWMGFFCLVLLYAVGSSVISFARDLALSVNASMALATTLVGVISIFNGLGRIITGAVFDVWGRRKTMIAANVLTIVTAAVTLISVLVGSIPLLIFGFCLTGLSIGSCPTVSAVFTSAFFGMKHFSGNIALTTFYIMGGSSIATVSNILLASSGGYVVPFIMLLALAVIALPVNISIRHP